jgi:hypothetical protein
MTNEMANIMKNGKTKNWSQTYYSGLTKQQHKANNHWFKSAINVLAENGIIKVPELGKTFTVNGFNFTETA